MLRDPLPTFSPRRLVLHGASHSAEIGDDDLPESFYFSPRLLSAISAKHREQHLPLDKHQQRLMNMASAAIPIIHRYDSNGERRMSETGKCNFEVSGISTKRIAQTPF
ncbi:unnamed protein product [Strongylus vulgaris]|uniref:Uncharacterized protein n=1 Tax=Strongylus vulgaris TaxID=40348 RepID=A0A3P7LMN5_STRVU|nr:unnamed protein product [Strongylus vulgaris]